jgi:hypothetical protein
MPRRPRRRTAGRARRSRPATAGPRPGSASTVCLRGVTHRPPLGRCHTAAAHMPARAAAFLHWPEPRCTSPTGSAPCRRSCRPRSSGETASTRRRAYKTPSFFPLRAPASTARPPPSTISAAGELPLLLAPVAGQRLKATP